MGRRSNSFFQFVSHRFWFHTAEKDALMKQNSINHNPLVDGQSHTSKIPIFQKSINISNLLKLSGFVTLWQNNKPLSTLTLFLIIFSSEKWNTWLSHDRIRDWEGRGEIKMINRELYCYNDLILHLLYKIYVKEKCSK